MNRAIPYPAVGEKRLGGHAIMAVGYDDEMRIENPGSKLVTKGALLIRNSWGKYRMRSVESITREIDYLVGALGTTHLTFLDFARRQLHDRLSG